MALIGGGDFPQSFLSAHQHILLLLTFSIIKQKPPAPSFHGPLSLPSTPAPPLLYPLIVLFAKLIV